VNVDLRMAAADYLRLRRCFGYRLADHDWLIAQFLDLVAERGRTTITVDDAIAFAQAPAATSRRWHAARLAVIRGLAAYVHATDPAAAELIPPELIYARRGCRRIPYLYSQEQITALMSQAETLRPRILAATMHTLIGLVAVTGMRSGEALGINVEDLTSDEPAMTVTGKYGKKRLIPLHPSSVQALTDYLRLRAAVASTPHAGPLLIGAHGGRLNKNTARAAFRQIANAVDLPARPGAGIPRLHDFRHVFAVNSLIDAHRQGVDVDARIAALATYLGHVEPVYTYWYLTASTELMTLVRARMSASLEEPHQ
jgi:integrase